MPRTPARVTQADMARALRAAKAVGGVRVEVKRDGTILLVPIEDEPPKPRAPDPEVRIIL